MWRWALLWLALLCAGLLQAQPAPAALISVPGQAVQVAVDGAGNSFVLSPDGTPWTMRAANGPARSASWSRMPGSFTQLRSGPQGSVWAIDAQAVAYVWRGSWWQGMRPDVQDIAIDPDGEPAFLNGQGQITPPEKNAARDTMYKQAQAGFERIALDEYGLLWQWRTDGTLRRFDGVKWQEIHDFKEVGLRDLSLGAGGAAIGVTAQGNVLQRDPRSGRWQALQQPSNVQRVALSPWGGAWYALVSGQIVSSAQEQPIASAARPQAALFTRLLNWRKMRGMAQSISVALDGTTAVIDRNQTVWRLNAQKQWTPLVGRFTQVAAAPGGKLWAIDAEGRLLRQEGAQWMDSQMFAQAVAVGGAQEVWAIDLAGQLGQWNSTQKRWLRVETPSSVKAVSIGAGNSPWVIDEKGMVYQRIGERWQVIPGIEAQSIGVGTNGAVYASTPALQLYWLDRASLEWKPAVGTARTVVVGPGDQPWVIDEQYALLQSVTNERERILEIPLPGGISPQSPPALITIAPPAASSLPTLSKPLVYSSVGSGFRDVGIGADGTVFAAGAGGSLYCLANPNRQFQMAAAGTVSRVAVGANGNPWVINGFGQVSYFEKSSWSVVPGISAQDVSVSGDGIAFIAQAERAAVYRFDPSRRELLEVTQYSSGIPLKAKRLAAAGNTLWAVTPASQVLKCSGKECQLQQISASDIAVGPEGSVFALDLNGSLQRYNPRTNSFLKVNGQGHSVAVGPQGLPWLVSNSGEIQSSGLFAEGSKVINPANCGAKFAAAPVPQIPNPAAILIARDDVLTLAAGANASILANDSLNGRAPSFELVRVTLNNAHAGLRYDRGQIIVAASALPGSILASGYTLCAEPGGVPCVTAKITVQVPGTQTVTVTVTISASNDSATLNPGGTLNLLANDSLNGNIPTAAQVSISVSSGSSFLSQSAGLLTMSNSVPLGSSHTASYRLCALPAGTPCSNTATVAISVPAGSTISATPDTANLAAGGTINLLANDNLNGSTPTSGQVNVSFASLSPQLTQVGGLLTVNAAALPGTSHTASYSICASPAGTPCSNTVTVIINVPASISAAADSATLNPGGALNLLANDNLNGSAPTPAQVNVSFASQSPQLTQAGGLLTLNAAAAPGSSHTASYSICSLPGGSQCSSTVTVVINVLASISAIADSATLNPGGTLNLLGNDNLNSSVPISSQVNVSFASLSAQLTQVGGLLSLNVAALPGTSHTASYSICASPAGTPCSNTVTVIISVPSNIVANADITTLIPGLTLNLLANDSLNGVAPTSAQVNVIFVSQSPMLTQVGGLLTFNDLAIGGSSHTASYSLCVAPAGVPCSNTVTVVMTAPVTISASADSAALNPGGTLNLLTNDNLNGSTPTSGQVNVSFTSLSPQLTQAGGLLTLNAAALAGSSHTASYRICALPGGAPCSNTVTVVINVPASISATADSATLSPGGTLNLLGNDSLNGSAPSSGQVSINFVSQSPQLTQAGGLLTLDSLAAGGSSHTASYRICALPGGSPCSNTVTVVISTPITAVAVADIVSNFPRNIFFGIGLHDNDTLNGVLVPPGAADVQYTLNNNTAIFTLSIDGYLELVDDVLTPPGTYNLTYTFCELGVPTNCSSATAQITVTVN